MNQSEALRRALGEIGDVSAQELATFMQKNYGVKVRPQIIPILKATLRDKENLAEWRRKSAAAQASSLPPAEAQPKPA